MFLCKAIKAVPIWVLSKSLDLVFGKPEPFDYTSTTMPRTDPPMDLTNWNLEFHETYDHEQLCKNFEVIDRHDGGHRA